MSFTVPYPLAISCPLHTNFNEGPLKTKEKCVSVYGDVNRDLTPATTS